MYSYLTYRRIVKWLLIEYKCLVNLEEIVSFTYINRCKRCIFTEKYLFDKKTGGNRHHPFFVDDMFIKIIGFKKELGQH